MTIVGSAGSGLGGVGDIGGALGSFYSHAIDQSLRFEDGDSPRLSLDPIGSPTGSTKCTISFWLKRGNLGSTQIIFTGEQSNIYIDQLWFDSSDKFNHTGQENTVSEGYVTTAVFRDTSAWYHFVVELDSTLSTAADRVKIYVNGVLQDKSVRSGYTAYNQNHEFYYNKSGNSQNIGRSENYGNSFDGYIAEFNFIDGTALTADSFGETKDGIWVPKNVSGLTYGNNGFHLDFADSSAIGNDVSGQNNDFAVAALVASDVVPDSPTNNFAVMNLLDQELDATTKEGNLFVTTSNAGRGKIRSTFTIPETGKWYWEAYLNSSVTDAEIGVAPQSLALKNTDQLRVGADNYTYRLQDGQKGNNNTKSSYGDALASGDVASVLFDADAGAIYFYKNGTIQNSGTAAFTSIDTTLNYCPAMGDTATSTLVKVQWNFGQDSTFAGRISAGGNSDSAGIGDFKYAVPSGAKALCSANLPEPVIIDGSEYFNSVLYTGNSGTQAITGVGFQPNWVWNKVRNHTYSHASYDSVRGTNQRLYQNHVYNEATDSGLTSFDTDGFTLGSAAGANASGKNYVSWNWKAGTAVSGNTTGSGTAKAYSGSVNAESGFSIITYKGNGTAGHTIPHNLGAKPSMVLFKNRDEDDQWAVYHKDILATHNLCLNNTDGNADQDNRFNDTEPTDSVMTLGTGHVVNATDEDYIAYFFTDIDQYCKAGVYSGNSSANGAYVHTGFAVSWLMVKSTSSGTQWMIYDNKRLGYNVDNNALTADDNATEKTDNDVDLLSNGFKWRRSSPNFNQSSYIYLAFAEQPAKYSNAR